MAEPISSAVTTKSLYVTFGFIAAATANAFQEVQKKGWKGIWMFLGNILVAVVAGNVVYSWFEVFKPEYALASGFAAAYIGPNSVSVLWEAIKKTITSK